MQCVLAAIIIVSLKGIFLQFTQLPQLFRRSLSDSLVWLVTFWATVMLDVHLGRNSIHFEIIKKIFTKKPSKSYNKLLYESVQVTMVVTYLGWVDLDF